MQNVKLNTMELMSRGPCLIGSQLKQYLLQTLFPFQAVVNDSS
jgi:hypothetical protein